MATTTAAPDCGSTLSLSGQQPDGTFRRKLGNNELFCKMCHSTGNLNVMSGLTLLTRTAVDEGLMKCALQEFQHMYPQLTSRIRDDCFLPMECPTFPLDTEFQTKDMLHTKFDVENGPLWKVQLITEATMEKAAAGLEFGPELEAIIQDDSSTETRWRYFLRYFQGKVNQSDIEDFDEEEEGFRSFILMVFHPSITDTQGSFHLLRQFLVILDSILEQDANVRASVQPNQEDLHLPIESLLPQTESGFQMGDLFPMAKVGLGFMMPRKSPFEEIAIKHQPDQVKTEVLRGWLSVEQTSDLIATMEEDDVSLHGTILAAGLTAMSRILQSDQSKEYPPSQTLNLRATNEANLRQYCPSGPRHGCLTTYYEGDYVVPPISDRQEFWRYAHELTVKHNSAKGNREPLKLLRVYNKMLSLSSPDNFFKEMESHRTKVQNELGVAVYGDLGNLFRRENPSVAAFQSLETWNRPLSGTQRNIRLEDVFHAVSAQDMGSPVTHSAHILHKRLNYILMYHSGYIEQRHAFMVRDEMVNILRMATEPQ